MFNSESDFLGSISSDILFTNELIQNNICRNIMKNNTHTANHKKRKDKAPSDSQLKRKRTELKAGFLKNTEFEKNNNDKENEDSITHTTRRKSVCLIFTSEMSDDGFSEMIKESVHSKFDFKSVPKKKSFSLFEDSFHFSSDNNLSCDKKDIRLRNSDAKLFLNSFNKIYSSDKHSNQNVLDQKPFKSHWALIKNNKSRIYSVPETRSIKEPLHRKHLIDFWQNIECDVKYSLPILGSGSSDSLMRISVDTVCKILKCSYDVKFTIIDCRFEYEFDGGHIKSAININTTDKMDHFYTNKASQVLIFHCEYSSIRAPRLAHYLRNMDRNLNLYPNLKFPEIYIMEGGYKKFYEMHQIMCTPMRYVSMDDTIEKENSKNTHL